VAKYRFVGGKLMLVEGVEPSDKAIGPSALHFFREGWYEHIGDDPIYVSSMDQLKRECSARGETSLYERETSYGTKPKRWV
jgi:hypothetical protein